VEPNAVQASGSVSLTGIPARANWQVLDGLYGLSIVLVLAIGASATALMRDGEHQPPATPLMVPPKTAVHEHRALIDSNIVADIVRGHLFGASLDAQSPGLQRINMTLSGVIALPDPTRGYAIIRPDVGAAHLYAAGAPLPGAATLLEVYRDRVIVEVGGARVELRLPFRIAISQFAALSITNSPTEDLESGPPRFDSASFQAKALDVLPVSTGAARILRPEAVVEDGKLRGYQIFPADPEKLGVSSGDELVAINDKGLQDPARAAHVMEELDSSSSANVKLTLLHNGQSYDLVVSADTLRWHRP
jgi:type II secretion system protein C